jgi:acyl carrier protein
MTTTLDLPATTAKVIAILEAEFPPLRKIGLRPDTALLSAGRLDSFGIVTLVATLDAEFGIDVDVEQVEIESFETPASIAALCVAAQGRRG